MTRKFTVAALFASASIILPASAWAQEPASTEQPEPTEPDASDATADAAIAGAAEIDDAKAQIELLKAQVEALQEALEGVKSQMVKTTPSWKGAPQFEDKEAGWTFKPRGRLMFDAGYVSNPDNVLATRNLGFNARARRIRLGAEGTIPGDLGYKFEMDFANAATSFGDVIVTYAPKGKPFSFTVGNHETFESLEQITSSRFSTFIERAQMNDAFGHARRIGLSMGLQNKPGDLRLNAGLFAGHSIDGTFNDDGWIAAARATYSPQALGGLLHLGANIQHRHFSSNNDGADSAAVASPSNNQRARYRARPFTQTTDQRFVDTNTFAASSDTIVGAEAAGVFKSLHVASEAQWTKVNAYRPGDRISETLDRFPSNSQWVPTGDPAFFSAYGEVGYFLTGETRGYKAGAWDRTKVLKPFGGGGWGALQLNARVDYLDLDSGKLKRGCTNNFTTGACTGAGTAAAAMRGGKQVGYLLGLTWIPQDYFRVLVNYAHADITGGPVAQAVSPTTPIANLDRVNYGVDTLVTRFQVDF